MTKSLVRCAGWFLSPRRRTMRSAWLVLSSIDSIITANYEFRPTPDRRALAVRSNGPASRNPRLCKSRVLPVARRHPRHGISHGLCRTLSAASMGMGRRRCLLRSLWLSDHGNTLRYAQSTPSRAEFLCPPHASHLSPVLRCNAVPRNYLPRLSLEMDVGMAAVARVSRQLLARNPPIHARFASAIAC